MRATTRQGRVWKGIRRRQNCTAAEVVEWIEEHLIPEPNSGCFLWTGSVGSHGYGDFRWRGQNHTVPRFVLEYHTDPLGELQALHTCDVRLWGRLDHLFRGTPLANTHDMMAKGRQRLTPEFLHMQRAGVPKRRCS